jgi:hypothetical protein
MATTEFESALKALIRRIWAHIPPPPGGLPELQLRFQALKEFITVYLAANSQQQATVLKYARKCVNQLWVFSMDMAAEAVQTNNLEGVFVGLIALGLENVRTDERDTIRALSTLFHSIKKLHGSEGAMVQRVLPLVPDEFGRCLQEFASRSAEFKSIEIMGFEEGEIDGKFAYVDA